MNVVMLRVGEVEVALDAVEVERFDGEGDARRVWTARGTALRFDRARFAAVEDGAIVALPALVGGLRSCVGARAVLLLDDRAVLLVAPRAEHASSLGSSLLGSTSSPVGSKEAPA